jgi:hypothetical protein
MNRVDRVRQNSNASEPPHYLFEQLHAFTDDLGIHHAWPRHVASGPREGRHQPEPYGIATPRHDDWDRPCGILRRFC